MSEKKVYLLKCIDCNAEFFTEGERIFYENKGLSLPKRCKSCRDKRKHHFEQERKEKERIETELELKQFLSALPFRQAEIIEIIPADPDRTLFIIGNGFDIMHGIPSRYYDFRDSLKENDIVKSTLETYIRQQDIWGDFENNLAYLDREAVLCTIDDRLDDFDVPHEQDENFSAGNFFAAQETVVTPIFILTEELPRRFRRWVNSLSLQNTSKPLECLLHPRARYINFNYTEFPEIIYGIPKDHLLYIHGDRRDKKGQLVLGHGHDTDRVFEEWYQSNKDREDFRPKLRGRKGRLYHNDNPVYLAYFLRDDSKGNWKSQVRYDAISNTVRMIEEYYDDAAKKTSDVLAKNQAFFQSLANMKEVVIIGHSLSEVDHPYFKEIIRKNANHTEIKWYIGWHSPSDLERIIKFISNMDISTSNIVLFKT